MKTNPCTWCHDQNNPKSRTCMLGLLVIGDQLVASWSLASWSELSSGERWNATIAIAEPFTAFLDGTVVVQNKTEVAGKVALIWKNTITSGELAGNVGYSAKAKAASSAGAIGVIFVNDDEVNANDVIQMGTNGEAVQIPVLMVSHNEGVRLKDLGSGTPVVITAGQCVP